MLRAPSPWLCTRPSEEFQQIGELAMSPLASNSHSIAATARRGHERRSLPIAMGICHKRLHHLTVRPMVWPRRAEGA